MSPLLLLGLAGAGAAGYWFFIHKKPTGATSSAAHTSGTLTPLPPGSPGLANLPVGWVDPGGDYTIATEDTGPEGRLTARATPAGAIIGSFEHGAIVHYVEGPDGTNRWIRVSGTDAQSGQPITGWVANAYLGH